MVTDQKIIISILVVVALGVSAAGAYVYLNADDEQKSLMLATTTSTQDSGLLDYILPGFEEKNGAKVKVIAVGSGQAMELGKRGDVDILLVHSPASEKQFVSNGYGESRTLIMYNQFVIVGPACDPAGTKGAHNATDAFNTIMDNGTAGEAILTISPTFQPSTNTPSATFTVTNTSTPSPTPTPTRTSTPSSTPTVTQTLTSTSTSTSTPTPTDTPTPSPTAFGG